MASKLEILIIGGSAAGPTAASTAQRNDPAARITMLEQGEHVSVAA